MIKKLLKIFKNPESEKEQRNRFRFDVRFTEALSAKVGQEVVSLKEISLEGMSIVKEGIVSTFAKKEVHTISLSLEGVSIDIKVEIVNVFEDIVGVKIVSNKESFNDFVVNSLSPYLISFSS